MNIYTEVLNADKLIEQLKQLSEASLKKALTDSCLLVQNEAKTICPVDSGRLRSSISYEVDNDNGFIGTNTEYAPWIEMGTGLFSSTGDGRQDPWSYQDASGQWHHTSGMKPQPFLKPALTNNANRIVDIFKEAIKEEIRNG